MDILGEDTRFKKDYFNRLKKSLNLPNGFDMSEEGLRSIAEPSLELNTIVFCLYEPKPSGFRKGLEKYFNDENLEKLPTKQDVIETLKNNYGNNGTDRQFELMGELYWDSVIKFKQYNDFQLDAIKNNL